MPTYLGDLVSQIIWLNMYVGLFLCSWYLHVGIIILDYFLICMWYYFVAACINELYSYQPRANWTNHTDKTQL
jgi:hypothetical protein